MQQHSDSDLQSTKYDRVNSGKSHQGNSNSFMAADSITFEIRKLQPKFKFPTKIEMAFSQKLAIR